MSVKAMEWAWRQEGLPSLTHFILLALADRANDQGVCWPGQETIARRCGTTPRSVRRHIASLASMGLIKVQMRHNSRGAKVSNLYTLDLGSVVSSLPQDTADPTLRTAYPLPEGTGVPSLRTGLSSEPSSEPSREPAPSVVSPGGGETHPPGAPRATSESGEGTAAAPEWYAILRTLPSFRADLAVCRAWLARRGVSAERAEEVATDLRAKWGARGWRYKDPWATFQSWARRPPRQERPLAGVRGPPGGDLSSEARRAELRRMAAEMRERDPFLKEAWNGYKPSGGVGAAAEPPIGAGAVLLPQVHVPAQGDGG